MKAKLKDHWGLLPTFDLSTPGNVEAWNKLRLYLQSAQIKSSRYKQVSVLWCFVAVVIMAFVKIVEMITIYSAAGPKNGHCGETTDADGCKNAAGCMLSECPRACMQGQCTSGEGQPGGVPLSLVDYHTDGNTTAPIFYCTQFCSLAPDATCGRTFKYQLLGEDCRPCLHGNPFSHHEWGICNEMKDYNCAGFDLAGCQNQDACSWDMGTSVCKHVEQHFDTMTLFVLVDTLLIGIGLLITLWQGMLSNEIKREAFPYVIRMKLSEMLSASMNFVTERAAWELHKRSWRRAEVQLLGIVRQLEEVTALKDEDLRDKILSDRHTQRDTQRGQRKDRKEDARDEAKKLKEKGVDLLLEEGFYSFIASKKPGAAARHHPDPGVAMLALQDELLSRKVVKNEEDARTYSQDLFNAGCVDIELLKYLVNLTEIGTKEPCALDMKARYPFGPASNRAYPHWVEDVDLSSLTSGGPEPEPEPERIGVSRHVSPQRAGRGWEPEPEPEPESGLGAPSEESAQRLLHELQELRRSMDNHTSKLLDAERQRCIQMLKVLADTLDDEYNEGGRAHWGSEDRCA